MFNVEQPFNEKRQFPQQESYKTVFQLLGITKDDDKVVETSSVGGCFLAVIYITLYLFIPAVKCMSK